MIAFTALIKKFGQNGEKTGWTYIEIPAQTAQQLKPQNKKSFRVKGRLDNYSFERIALVPAGNGGFIMPLNAVVRKGIGKGNGASVQVKMEVDINEIQPPTEFIECLKDEPAALTHFLKLPKSHQNYYNRWIESAKTDATKAKRIAQAVDALAKQMHFGQMIRSIKNSKDLQA